MARKAPPKTRARVAFFLAGKPRFSVPMGVTFTTLLYVRRHPVTSKTFAVSALIRKSIPLLPLLFPSVSREKLTVFLANTNTYCWY